MRIKLSALLLVAAASAHASDRLDNHAVVEMVQLGLDKEIIQAKIDATPNAFDTSPASLAALKQKGVSSEIIGAMIKATNTALNASKGGTEFSLAGDGVRETALSPVRVTPDISHRKRWIPVYGAFAKTETFMKVQGKQADTRTGARPEFITSLDPTQIRLVHFGHDGDQRYMVFSGNTSDRELQTTSEKLGDGRYRVRPKEELVAGEYAFLIAPEMRDGLGFWALYAQLGPNSAKGYDFGVD